MRITILLFSIISCLLLSCNSDRTELRKFDMDCHDYFFFNPGSYWVYLRDDLTLDTIRLIDVETTVVPDFKGDQETEYRIDKYWSTADEEYFERHTKDSVIFVYNESSKLTEPREVFILKNKFQTIYSNYFKSDNFVDNTCNIIADGDSTVLGKDYPTKTYIGDFVHDFHSPGDTIFYVISQKSTATYAKNLGMTRYKAELTDTTWSIELVGYHLE